MYLLNLLIVFLLVKPSKGSFGKEAGAHFSGSYQF